MAKLKIAIDNDIHFLVIRAEAGAFGYTAEAKVKVKRASRSGGVSALPAPDIYDPSSEEQPEEIHVVPDSVGGDED